MCGDMLQVTLMLLSNIIEYWQVRGHSPWWTPKEGTSSGGTRLLRGAGRRRLKLTSIFFVASVAWARHPTSDPRPGSLYGPACSTGTTHHQLTLLDCWPQYTESLLHRQDNQAQWLHFSPLSTALFVNKTKIVIMLLQLDEWIDDYIILYYN